MKHVTLAAKDWSDYPSRDFAAWFNQLEGMRSPVLIGTADARGATNVAVFNSLTHVGARPPLLGFVLRPLTVERHTYANLKAAGTYTVNHVDAALRDRAHRTSGKFPTGVSEFDACDIPLTEARGAVPYVRHSPVSMLLEFVEEHFVAANDTVFVVGRVVELRLAKTFAFGKRIDWAEARGQVVSGLYDYYDVRYGAKLEYVTAPARSGGGE